MFVWPTSAVQAVKALSSIARHCGRGVERRRFAPVGHHLEGTVEELRGQVAQEISPIAKPREIHVVPELPKTRSGKIMRRLLRDVAENRELGDTSTLLDPGVFDAIRATQ